MISHVFTPDSILCYVSPWAAQSCCDHRAQGGVFRAAAFPAHTGRAVGAPALLPGILGGSRWRCSHGRQLELWELQAVWWRMPFHCPGENSSWEQLHPKACKLHFGVTIPKWTVHAVLEERTFIPARVSFGVFYLTWCLNVHHRYCGSESPAALPDSIQHSFAASSLQQLVSPRVAAQVFVCISLPKGSAERRALGQERGCCQGLPPALMGYYPNLI